MWSRENGRAAPVRLTHAGGFEELREVWSALALRARSVFATPEWAAAWWRHFGRGRPLRLVVVGDGDDRPAAILPLYEHAAHPVRVLRFVGHGPADRCGPVCAPEDRALAALGARRALDELHGHVLLGEQLPGGDGWATLLHGRVLGREGCPVLRIRGRSWEELLRTGLAGVGRKARRDGGRLERDHDVRVRRAGGAGGGLDADLDRLVALHEARWGGPTWFSGPHAAFHRDFAVVAQSRGWLELSFLEVDGRAVAAVHDLRFAGAQAQYQLGRDPAWNHASVGFLALAAAVRRAAEDGMEEYSFGRGDESYKYRFADADPGLESVAAARGAVASAAVLAGGGAPRAVLEPVRRWLAA